MNETNRSHTHRVEWIPGDKKGLITGSCGCPPASRTASAIECCPEHGGPQLSSCVWCNDEHFACPVCGGLNAPPPPETQTVAWRRFLRSQGMMHNNPKHTGNERRTIERERTGAKPKRREWNR